MVYERSFTTTGVDAGSPWRMALASSSISWGVKPERAAIAGIDVHDDGRSADGILDAVFDVGHGFDFLDAIGDFLGPRF